MPLVISVLILVLGTLFVMESKERQICLSKENLTPACKLLIERYQKKP